MKRIEDERILNEKRKINSSAFGICFLALWGILLYRQFILEQNISEYLDIFLLTIGISVYLTVNSVMKGLYLTYRSKSESKKVNLISALVGSAMFAIIQIFAIDVKFVSSSDIIKLLISCIIFFAVWITAQSLLLNFSEKKANNEIEE